MAIHRLNHAVLFIRDVAASVQFYTDVLGFTVAQTIPGQAAFLRAPESTNDHDLGLFQVGAQATGSAAGRGSVGLYHLAWEVQTLADLEVLRGELAEAGALTGMSDHGSTKSLYGKDPDGLEFEIVWLVPAHLLTDDIEFGTRPLDLVREMARYGRDTRGGLGISVPLGVTV
ncbi:VOC family protein [Microlunatus panaciterrae]|uniref:Catechol-2,3-dioxygenase n=1 Tax=Microlunatus panaciterrae TaxID=400768 RepID=A0ABS2RH72_9ACTN|nr:VOC family protein [Microlunatus panaciterrae]MBM7798359.1 catechol-2,3-dioxygenase [Microlunatus panaciterrae]